MGETLDKKLIRLSVSKIITDLFYSEKPFKRGNTTSGSVLHYRLGFTGDEVYCRFLELPETYVKLCGAPDRIMLANGKLYVDELKTTYNHQGYMEKVAYTQLQLYMFLTGIPNGRIWIYDKRRGELRMIREVEYNESFVVNLLRKYVSWLDARNSLLNKY